MRIPPYYRKPTWQRFFTGMAMGAVLSWGLFVYIYGVTIEKNAKTIHEQKNVIAELEKDIKIWQDDYAELNKKNEEKLTVQAIKIKIMNGKKYRLDALSIYEIEEQTRSQLNILLAKDLDTVFKSRELMTKLIESQSIPANDKRYKLKIKSMVIYTTVSIQVELMLD